MKRNYKRGGRIILWCTVHIWPLSSLRRICTIMHYNCYLEYGTTMQAQDICCACAWSIKQNWLSNVATVKFILLCSNHTMKNHWLVLQIKVQWHCNKKIKLLQICKYTIWRQLIIDDPIITSLVVIFWGFNTIHNRRYDDKWAV